MFRIQKCTQNAIRISKQGEKSVRQFLKPKKTMNQKYASTKFSTEVLPKNEICNAKFGIKDKKVGQWLLFGGIVGGLVAYSYNVYGDDMNNELNIYQSELSEKIKTVRKENWPSEDQYPRLSLSISEDKIIILTIDLSSIEDPVILFNRIRKELNIRLSSVNKGEGVYNCNDYTVEYQTSGENNSNKYLILTYDITKKDEGTKVLCDLYKITLEESEFWRKQNIVKQLKQFGVDVYLYEKHKNPQDDIEKSTSKSTTKLSWDNLVGYEDVKQTIIDSIILPLQHPEMYALVSESTRQIDEDSKPCSILFEGPPGTGKTTSARILSSIGEIPLIVLKFQNFASKYYGETTHQLSDILDLCRRLGKCFVFIDEIDGILPSRDKDSHEVTHRLLNQFLELLDGFDQNRNLTIICATNRKEDLDPALLNRFTLTLQFDLPDENTRFDIFHFYAKQLSQIDLKYLSSNSDGFSGRDIREVCLMAESKWVANLIRKNLPPVPPPMEYYKQSFEKRKKHLEKK